MSHTKKQKRNRSSISRTERRLAAEKRKAAGIYFEQTLRGADGKAIRNRTPLIDMIASGTVCCTANTTGEQVLLRWDIVSLTKGYLSLPFRFIVLYGAIPKDGKEFSSEDTHDYVDFIGAESLDTSSSMNQYNIGAVLMFSEDGQGSSVGIIGDVFDLDDDLDEAYLEKLRHRMWTAHRFAVEAKLSPTTTLITVVTGADIDCQVSTQLGVHELTAIWMKSPETIPDNHWSSNVDPLFEQPPPLSTDAIQAHHPLRLGALSVVGEA